MASSKHPLHRYSQGYVMTCRRPPVMRRTATTVLAGGPYSGWHNPDELDLLKFDSQSRWDDTATPIESAVNPAAAQPLGLSSFDSTQTTAATTTGRRKSNARAKQKPKQAEQAKAVIDLGASIIPICAPGTGTPPPQPLKSYASSSSLTRSDFDTGASSRMDEEEEEYLAAAIVGKRSRARSISSQHSTRLPISPPVTSPNASASELPNINPFTKRAREGREPVRRKRRKTTSSTVSTSTRGGEDEAVFLVPIINQPSHLGNGNRPTERDGKDGSWLAIPRDLIRNGRLRPPLLFSTNEQGADGISIRNYLWCNEGLGPGRVRGRSPWRPLHHRELPLDGGVGRFLCFFISLCLLEIDIYTRFAFCIVGVTCILHLSFFLDHI
ncbi:hypothetical protein B0J17DRAFT_773244 [Rhizoctonia solani]|nr:hypothetical protein B0J17DRAFT_773244 [Rhizoctonia solani]